MLNRNSREINISDKFIGDEFGDISLIQNPHNNINLINVSEKIYEVSGNFRNDEYDIIWQATPVGQTEPISYTLKIKEMPPIPVKIFSDADLIIHKDEDKTYNISAIFFGVDLIYQFLKNPLDSYLTDTQLFY